MAADNATTVVLGRCFRTRMDLRRVERPTARPDTQSKRRRTLLLLLLLLLLVCRREKQWLVLVACRIADRRVVRWKSAPNGPFTYSIIGMEVCDLILVICTIRPIIKSNLSTHASNYCPFKLAHFVFCYFTFDSANTYNATTVLHFTSYNCLLLLLLLCKKHSCI